MKVNFSPRLEIARASEKSSVCFFDPTLTLLSFFIIIVLDSDRQRPGSGSLLKSGK